MQFIKDKALLLHWR